MKRAFSFRPAAAACAAAVVIAVAPAGAAAQGADIPASPPAATAPAARAQPAYRLQVGDRLDLKFFYASQLNESVKVPPDGRLSLQLIGAVQAAGVTIPELEAELRKRYSASLQRPDVAVVIQDFAPPRLYVAGEVRTPGIVEMRGPMTALQSIVSAGGFTPDAKAETVIVLRYNGDDPPTYMQLNLKPSTKKRQVEDVELQAFDILYVPKTRIATVAQFFDRYIGAIVPLYRTLGLNFWYDLRGNRIEVR